MKKTKIALLAVVVLALVAVTVIVSGKNAYAGDPPSSCAFPLFK